MEDLLPKLATIEWSLIAVILFVAFTIRGMAGFGSGSIAIPLIALMLPITIVVPVLGVLDYLAASVHGIQQRQAIRWNEIKWLALPVVLGTVIAYFVFRDVDNDSLKKGLGVFVFLYGIYVLFVKAEFAQKARAWSIPMGLSGGFISTLYGTGGPFYVIYLTLRKLNKEQFRATVSTVFIFEGANRMIAYWVGDLLNMQTLALVGLAIPFAAIAMYLGEHIHTSVSARSFSRAIAVLLLISGMALILK